MFSPSRLQHGNEDVGCIVYLLCCSYCNQRQKHKASICVGCQSPTQQFSTEQIEWDRKSHTDTTLKHPVNFQNIKKSRLMLDCFSPNFINMCVRPGLKSIDQRFTEAAVALDPVITAKSHCLRTPAVPPCCALKHSRLVLTEDRANLQHYSGIPKLQDFGRCSHFISFLG